MSTSRPNRLSLQSLTHPRVPQAILAAWLLAAVGSSPALGGSSAAPKEQYVAEALFQFAAKTPFLLDEGHERFDAEGYKLYQQTQLALLKSDFLLRAAVRRPGVASLPSLADVSDPVEWLTDHVEAEFLGQSQILSIRLQGSDPNEVKQLVDAVAEAYQREVVFADKQRKLMARDAKFRSVEKLRKKLTNKLEEYQSLANEGAGNSPKAQLLQDEIDSLADLHKALVRSVAIDDVNEEASDRIRMIQNAVIRPK